MNTLRVKRIYPDAVIPRRASNGSVGYDLFAYTTDEIEIKPGETRPVGTGIAIALEEGFAAFVYARSGLGIKHGINPANGVGVIDYDYRGEIIVGLRNSSGSAFVIKPFDRIAQMVITQCMLPTLEVCEDLDSTQRGDNGFGSTGGGV